MKATSEPKPYRPGRRLRAFTLVELLVVIGIMGLLMSLLMPALSKVRQAAQQANCANNLRQFGIAFIIYADANNGSLPLDGEDGDSPGSSIQGPDGMGWESPALWFNALPPLVKGRSYEQLQKEHAAGIRPLPREGNHDIFVCGSAGPAVPVGNDTVQNGYFIMYGRVGNAPAVPRPTYICYVYNSKLFGSTNPRGKIAQLRPTAEVVLLVEKRMSPAEIPPGVNEAFNTYDGRVNRLRTRTLGRLKGDWQRTAGRHNQGGLLLFADGHVQWYRMADVIKPGSGSGATADWNRPGSIIWDYSGPARR